MQFFGQLYMSALGGYCALQFLHALEIDQFLLAHTSTGKGSSKNVNREYLKFSLKFSVCAPIITSGLVGV